MADKVSLVDSGRDTARVADYVYARTFGAAASSDLLFAFKKENLDVTRGYLEFYLDEFGLGTKKQMFRFDVEDFERAPKVYKNMVSQ